MDSIVQILNSVSLPLRLLIITGIALATHLLVLILRHLGSWVVGSQHHQKYQKLRSIGTITTSSVVFALYFFSAGLILREFGVSLSTYLASVSVVGLALGFGLQGLVQDVVSGLTLIFSDLIDVDDLVKINDQVGIVKSITMRFVELNDALGATAFIPNRSIVTIINFPRGYIRCIADITLTGTDDTKNKMESVALELMNSTYEQFEGIGIRAPTKEGRFKLTSGKEFLRIKFRIWPNRGAPIETQFVKELLASLKKLDSEYQDWMVSINYEVEKKVELTPSLWGWKMNKSKSNKIN